MQVKVIIEDGIVTSVLTSDTASANGANPDIEIVDICDAYLDYKQLLAYRDELYHNPDFKEAEFTTARFEPDDPESV